MSARLLKLVVMGLILSGTVPCKTSLMAAPASPVAAAPAVPSTPSELFSSLARNTRPQWRLYFRDTVPRSPSDRYKASLALGAICADCYLAAEGRDAQQVRNLLNDMASLETILSISRQMSSLRQKPAEMAEAGDWPGVRAEVANLMAHHAKFLTAQMDGDLAELEQLGLWLRTLHVTTQFAARQSRPLERPPVWSSDFPAVLHSRAEKLRSRITSRTLQTLSTNLHRLSKIWEGESTRANTPGRLALSLPLLDAALADLVGEESLSARAPRRHE